MGVEVQHMSGLLLLATSSAHMNLLQDRIIYIGSISLILSQT